MIIRPYTGWSPHDAFPTQLSMSSVSIQAGVGQDAQGATGEINP